MGQGIIFDLDTFAVHDGPGIRMAVFFKGCPLSCRWCHSPESIRSQPEIAYAKDRCTFCGQCADACDENAHDFSHQQHLFHRQRCRACGACAEGCVSRALTMKGYPISAQTIIDRAVSMKPFFEESSGGITLTGGEVSLQAAFAGEILSGCRNEGIHTAIETCGACSRDALFSILAHTDLLFYDLKLIDDAAHRKWTGVSNHQILSNAMQIAGLEHLETVIRVPLIPEITDTPENLSAIFKFMKKAKLDRAQLLPYNAAAGAKYEWLDRPFDIQTKPQRDTALNSTIAQARTDGLDVRIQSGE